MNANEIQIADNDKENRQDEPKQLEERRPYEAPKVMKKRSAARVTLFSGGGVAAAGLTASG